MKQILVVPVIGIFLLSLFGTHLVWAKAHVPIDQLQVCASNGKVKNIKARRLAREVKRGGCRLPACDFDNIFMTGDSCDNVDILPASSGPDDPAGDGFCDNPGSPPTIPANSAVDMTSGCTNPY